MNKDEEYTIVKIDRDCWRKQAQEYAKLLTRLKCEVREFPELNMSNYNEADVTKLNDWGIAFHNMLFPYQDP